ncbi:histone-lysine N-methyltransferase EHMT1-like [Glandiceps talaboti]
MVPRDLRQFSDRRMFQNSSQFSFGGLRKSMAINRDLSRGRERLPIPVYNQIDLTPPPDDFVYIVESCLTQPLYIHNTINHLCACDCNGDCSSISICTCAVNSKQCWYDEDGKLKASFNFKQPPIIFECNRRCKCWITKCHNRVVQKGMRYQLQVFRTRNIGWGVRTAEYIPKGSYICEYVGEMITSEQADGRPDNYLFDLESKDHSVFCLDGHYYGNVSRFINHRCDPNIVPVEVYIEHQDLRCPRIAMFAKKDIAPYEQLGFNYGEKYWRVQNKRHTCQCGSTKCQYQTIAL